MKDIFMVCSLSAVALLVFVGMIIGVITGANDFMMGVIIVALLLQLANASFWVLYLECRIYKEPLEDTDVIIHLGEGSERQGS